MPARAWTACVAGQAKRAGRAGSAVGADDGGVLVVAGGSAGLLEQVVECRLGRDVLELEGDGFFAELALGILDHEVGDDGLVLAAGFGGFDFDHLVEGGEGLAEGHVAEIDAFDSDLGEFGFAALGLEGIGLGGELSELEAGLGVIRANFEGLAEGGFGGFGLALSDRGHAHAVVLVGLVGEGRGGGEQEGEQECGFFHGLVGWVVGFEKNFGSWKECAKSVAHQARVAPMAGRGHFGGVNEDECWMNRALDEGRRGIGKTAPNPPVGAVIVRDGIELGAGWHRRAGGPHAEREALAAVVAGHGAGAARGATAYVSLEPCSTYGRTPPCTEGLIEAGIARVVYGCEDPNPAHAGAAAGVLRAAGIEVVSGVLEERARELIRPFAKVVTRGLPWVLWKTAMSLDGRLTRPPGEGMWLTGEASRAEVQRLRGGVDAILTSGETVRRDRPRLDLRDPSVLAGREMPWRVVLTDRPGSLPRDAPLFTDPHRGRTLVRPRGDLAGVLRELVAAYGVNAVLLECGGRLAADFFAAGLVDEVVAFLAPVLCGGPVPALGGGGIGGGLEKVSFARFDDDVMLRGLVAQ